MNLSFFFLTIFAMSFFARNSYDWFPLRRGRFHPIVATETPTEIPTDPSSVLKESLLTTYLLYQE